MYANNFVFRNSSTSTNYWNMYWQSAASNLSRRWNIISIVVLYWSTLVCMWLFHPCYVPFYFVISRGQRIFPRRNLLSTLSTDLLYLNVFSSSYPTSGYLDTTATYYWQSHQRGTPTKDVVVHYITQSLWFCLMQVDQRGDVSHVEQSCKAQVLYVTLAGLFESQTTLMCAIFLVCWLYTISDDHVFLL